MTKRVMIIAGEASGDLHGAGVVRELKRIGPTLDVFGVGGDKMQEAGMELIYHIREINIMGFLEVIKHLPVLRSMKRTLGELLKHRRPDILLLIDYPGFNLRFAQIAKQHGIKIIYYISPQVWAWHGGRAKKMKKLIDKMLVVFPFEVEIYKRHNIDVEFVGHPLLEVLESKSDRKQFLKRIGLQADRRILAIFPGSRKQEIDQLIDVMIPAARMIAKEMDMDIVLGVAPTFEPGYFESLYDLEGIHLLKDASYELMRHSDFALVKSGTGTLETAWFGTPFFVIYKTSWITYVIGRLLVRMKHIGLVNIVAGKQIVPEFVQRKAKATEIALSAIKLLRDEHKLRAMKKDLKEIRERLGTRGASKIVAKQIIQLGRI